MLKLGDLNSMAGDEVIGSDCVGDLQVDLSSKWAPVVYFLLSLLGHSCFHSGSLDSCFFSGSL